MAQRNQIQKLAGHIKELTTAVQQGKNEQLIKDIIGEKTDNCDILAFQSAITQLGSAVATKLKSTETMKNDLLSAAEQSKRDLEKI